VSTARLARCFVGSVERAADEWGRQWAARAADGAAAVFDRLVEAREWVAAKAGCEPSRPPYLFHWCAADELSALLAGGTIPRGWTHYLTDRRRFTKGTCLCEEPDLWRPDPDEDATPEPCLVLRADALEGELLALESSVAFHRTKDMRAAVRRLGREGAEAWLDGELARRARVKTSATPDEWFLLAPLRAPAVAAIGVVDGIPGREAELVERLREELGVPLLDMEGWRVGDPGVVEVPELVEDCLDAHRTALTDAPRPG
jgi:hypothetical protein